MKTEPREPSRLPVRGAIASLGTIGALALLLSFKGGPLSPSDPAVANAGVVLQADDQLTSASATVSAAPDATLQLQQSAATASATPNAVRTSVGDAVSFRWGTVQVAATLDGVDIVDVQALQLPHGDRHSSHISEIVEPILREEAIASDSADVAVVSGATYTSEAYARSLQSALDQQSP